jgi:hypothetical protein
MCNVYLMYSYEPVKEADGTIKPTPPPAQMCWDNHVPETAK